MASRRDQAQAYRFLTRRQTTSLLRGDPDSPDAPTRKLNVTMLCGLLIAVLVAGGCWVFGLLVPAHSDAWRKGKALIVEKGTSSRFVYAGGRLHPVLNYASARLLFGGNGLTVAHVNAASLRGVPRGLPVGIPGAPDEIPRPSALLAAPWTACSYPATNAAGAVQPYVRLTLGGRPAGARLPRGRGLLVAAPDGTEYLIWNDQRFRLASASAVVALGYASARPLPVGAGWLGTVPQGPDLAPPPLGAAGAAAPPVGTRPARIGQVFSVAGAGTGTQFYVAFGDGLAPVTATQADLILGDPATRPAYPGGAVAAIPLGPGELSAGTFSAQNPARVSGLPDTPPTLLGSTSGAVAVCSSFTDASGSSVDVAIRALPLTPQQLAGTPPGTSPVADEGGPVADQVVVPAGHGAVVRALPAPGVPAGTTYLVTDLGMKFPLTSPDLLTALGLPAVPLTPVPTGVLQLLRTGPRLDTRDAAQTVAVLPDQNGTPRPQIPVPAATPNAA
ncbi:MAG: type VII secretion protein EccB [Mycobacteriales bacterium]